MACRRQTQVCSNLCPQGTVTESLEFQSHSSTSGVLNNSYCLELQNQKEQDSVLDYGIQTQKSHNHSLKTIVNISDCLSKRYCNGIMGVPITFLDKYNTKQFEIVGMDLNDSVKDLGIKEIGSEWVKLYRKQGGKGHITARMHSLVYTHNGKAVSLYRRILIRKKAGA